MNALSIQQKNLNFESPEKRILDYDSAGCLQHRSVSKAQETADDSELSRTVEKARGQFKESLEGFYKAPPHVQALFPEENLTEIKFPAVSPLGIVPIGLGATFSVVASGLFSGMNAALHYASFRHIPWFIPFNVQRSLQGFGFMTVLNTLKYYVKEGHQTYIQNGSIPEKNEEAPSFIRWFAFLQDTQKIALQFAPLKIGIEAVLTQEDKSETIVFSIQPREDNRGCDYEVVNGDPDTSDLYQLLEKKVAAFNGHEPISYQLKFFRSTKEVPETPQPSRLERVRDDVTSLFSWGWNHKKTTIGLIAAEALLYASANYCQPAVDLGGTCRAINFTADYIPSLSGVANSYLPTPGAFLGSLAPYFIQTGIITLIYRVTKEPEKLIKDIQNSIPWISKSEPQEPVKTVARAVDWTPELENFIIEQAKLQQMLAEQQPIT